MPLPGAVVWALACGLVAVPFALPGVAWELGWVRPPQRVVVPASIEVPKVPEPSRAVKATPGPLPVMAPKELEPSPGLDMDCPGAPPPTGGVEGPGETALRAKAPMTFVKLRAGAFTMGSERGENDERPCRRIELDGFELAKHEVTNAQWRAVMGKTPPSYCSGECPDDAPVTNVSWGDSIDFLNRLSQAEKRTECYRRDGQGRVTWRRSCDGYRLPTEAEWEYAARAGKVGAYGFDGGAVELGDHAWYSENSDVKVHPTGKKDPNGWELRDMHGNVWEWVWDKYGAYGNEPGKNPVGEDGDGPVNVDDKSGSSRVLRGGAFYFSSGYLRSARRFKVMPLVRDWYLGLRVARGPVSGSSRATAAVGP